MPEREPKGDDAREKRAIALGLEPNATWQEILDAQFEIDKKHSEQGKKTKDETLDLNESDIVPSAREKEDVYNSVKERFFLVVNSIVSYTEECENEFMKKDTKTSRIAEAFFAKANSRANHTLTVAEQNQDLFREILNLGTMRELNYERARVEVYISKLEKELQNIHEKYEEYYSIVTNE